jgi:hypothetical protein
LPAPAAAQGEPAPRQSAGRWRTPERPSCARCARLARSPPPWTACPAPRQRADLASPRAPRGPAGPRLRRPLPRAAVPCASRPLEANHERQSSIFFYLAAKSMAWLYSDDEDDDDLLPGFDFPDGVCVDASGHIYVADASAGSKCRVYMCVCLRARAHAFSPSAKRNTHAHKIRTHTHTHTHTQAHARAHCSPKG